MSHPDYDRAAALDPTNQQNAELAQLRTERDTLRAERDAARAELRQRWENDARNQNERDAARAELAALRSPAGDDVLRIALEDAILSNVMLEYGLENKDVSEILADISPHIRAMLAAERRKAIDDAAAACQAAEEAIGDANVADCIAAIRALAEPERGA
jgi:hypothetical protein